MNLTVSNLTFTYPGQTAPAVKGVSFSIESGEIFGFLGPSGAGKSTVQNILNNLLPLQEGTVEYDGDGIRQLNKSFFNKVGVSFEQANIYEKLTGYENLKYYAGLFDVPTEEPMKLLKRVGLSEHAHKRAGAYSKGMKQRLVFCRALINNPTMLFLDEPTSGLDPSTAEIVKSIIREKKAVGTTIFLTTHNMFTADQLCDRVAFLNEGDIVAMDSPRELKLQYGERSVALEYQEDGAVRRRIYFLNKEEDRAQFHRYIDEKEVQTIHSTEATLEQIFIQLTGRGLK